MEEIKNEVRNDDDLFGRWEKQHRRGRFIGGLFIAGAGVLFLMREMGVWFPEWMFSWQMLVIAVGLMSGAKCSFRGAKWLIVIAIGAAFLIDEYMPFLDFSHYLWPVILIIAGLAVMFRPGRRMHHRMYRKWERFHEEQQRYQGWRQGPASTDSPDDYIESNAVFGHIKKNIISKNFRGGEINCVFGGAEINFMQADINTSAELEVNAVFGGTRLIIPPNWEIKSEMTAVLGGVEDKRPLHANALTPGKLLILKGNAVFGGIEINSY